MSAAVILPSAAPQPPLDPKPISAALKRHFDEELSQIKTGRTGQVNLTATTAGVSLGGSVKKNTKAGEIEVVGYVGREWVTGWLAGGKVGFNF